MAANHAIVTRYERKSGKDDDYIGFHHDKEQDLTVDKPIIVISYGDDQAREFVVRSRDAQLEVVRFRMTAGAMVYLSYGDNLTHEHSIVRGSEEKLSAGEKTGKERISIVFRDVATVFFQGTYDAAR